MPTSKVGPEYSSKPSPAKTPLQGVGESNFCYATGCCCCHEISSSTRASYYFAGGSLSKAQIETSALPQEAQRLAEVPWVWARYHEPETHMRSLTADWVSASFTPQLPSTSEELWKERLKTLPVHYLQRRNRAALLPTVWQLDPLGTKGSFWNWKMTNQTLDGEMEKEPRTPREKHPSAYLVSWQSSPP